MEWILLFVVLAIVVRIKYHDLFTASKKQSSGREGAESSNNLHYELNPELFSAAERSFLHALDIALKGKLRIYAKVRVADIVNVKKGLSRSEWGAHFGRIKAKHFDYVLCHPKTMKVICVIELDDSSHNLPKRVKRDDFLNNLCKSIDLTLIRFKVQAGYNPVFIREKIIGSIKRESRPISVPEKIVPVHK